MLEITLFRTQSFLTMDLGKSNSEASAPNRCAIAKCILEACVSSPTPTADLPPTLTKMVFHTVRLLHASPLSHPTGLVQALLLYQWSIENSRAPNSPCWLCSGQPRQPRQPPGLAQFGCVLWPSVRCHC